MRALPINARPAPTWWNSRFTRRLRRNPLTLTGIAIVVLFILTALAAPWLAQPEGNCLRVLGSQSWARLSIAAPQACYEMPRISLSPEPTPPGDKGRLLGTSNGYDIKYGIVWGTRTAFTLGFSVIVFTLLIGVLVGAVSGYYGGWIDNLFMRFTDVIFAFPSLILTIVLISIFGRGLDKIILSLVLVGWATYARLVRAEILRVRQLEYVESARALGASDARILLRYVLPNSLTGLVVQSTLDMGAIVLSAAALSFIGLGTPVGYSDWGQLITFAKGFLQGPPGSPFEYWYVSFFPGLALVLWGLSWNLLGDALRDTLDPRAR